MNEVYYMINNQETFRINISFKMSCLIIRVILLNHIYNLHPLNINQL